MSLESLKGRFAKIGATLEVKVVPAADRVFRPSRWRPRASRIDYLFDVANDQRGERFALPSGLTP
jgi:hypothetical protein